MTSWIRRSVRLSAFTAVVGLSLLATGASAQATLDLDLKDAQLVSAIQVLANRSGVEFVVVDNPANFAPVTLTLRGKSADEALRLIVQSAGGYVEKNEGGVYIIRFGKPEATPAPQNNRPKEPLEKRVIRLRHADPSYVYSRLTGTWVEDPQQGFRQLQTFINSNTNQRPAYDSTRTVAVGQNVQVFDNQGLAERAGRESMPIDSSNGIMIPGESANQLGAPGGGNNGGFGNGGGQPGGGNGFGGGNGQQGGGVALNPGEGLVPDGITYLSYDPTDNSIVVVGTDSAIADLRRAIDLFDKAPKQVEVKVEFITTSQSVDKSFGIDWTFSRGSVFAGNAPGAFAQTGDPIFVNYSTGNLVTRLRTRLLDGEGKVVNAPLIRTFNNQPAVIQSQQTTRIFLPQRTVTQGVVVTDYTPQDLNITSNLAVRPRISEDGYITMTLSPTISDFGQLRTSPDGRQVIPDTLSQSIFVSTRVKSGETILLGGFNRKSNQVQNNRFPVLSDLPIIGQFFRSSSTVRGDSELLIFVTARIIEDPDDSATGP
ncbi:MAG: hypothetical protein J0L72_06490 [Armatimonadetes bacterium]|nr:hypothetical protein [Armatimonadota bacterium]